MVKKFLFISGLCIISYLMMNAYAANLTCPKTVYCTKEGNCNVIGNPEWRIDFGIGVTIVGTYQLVGAGYDGRFAFAGGGGAWCTYQIDTPGETILVEARNYAFRGNLVPDFNAGGDWTPVQNYQSKCHVDNAVLKQSTKLTPINPSACPLITKSNQQ